MSQNSSSFYDSSAFDGSQSGSPVPARPSPATATNTSTNSSTRLVDDPRLHNRARDKDLAGVGIVFVDGLNVNKSIAVMTLVRDGPAERDGTVQVGDIIVSVDGHNVEGQRLDVIRNMILGPPGTTVDLAFRSRENVLKHVTLPREKDPSDKLRHRIIVLEREIQVAVRDLQAARENLAQERDLRERLEKELRDMQEQYRRLPEELERERQLRQRLDRELRQTSEDLNRESMENSTKERTIQQFNSVRQTLESEVRLLQDRLQEQTIIRERMEVELRRLQADANRIRELERLVQTTEIQKNEYREKNFAFEQELNRLQELLRNQREPADRIVYVDREVFIEKPVDRTVYVDREIPIEKEIYIEVPVEKVVEKFVEVPVQKIVEKVVEVPVDRIVEVPVDRIIEKVIEIPVDRIVEKIVHVPVERIVEKYVEVPVEKIVEKPIYIEREGPTREVVVEKQVYVEKPVQQVVTSHQGPEMGGVGLLLKDDINDEEFEIERMTPGSPADQCGQIRLGDRVIGVDAYSVRARPLSLVKEYIRGPVGTPVTLHFRRGPTRMQRKPGDPEPNDGSAMFSVILTRGIEPIVSSQYAPPPVHYTTQTIVGEPMYDRITTTPRLSSVRYLEPAQPTSFGV